MWRTSEGKEGDNGKESSGHRPRGGQVFRMAVKGCLASWGLKHRLRTNKGRCKPLCLIDFKGVCLLQKDASLKPRPVFLTIKLYLFKRFFIVISGQGTI